MSMHGSYRYNAHNRGKIDFPVGIDISSNIFKASTLILDDPLSGSTGPPLYMTMDPEKPQKATRRNGSSIGLGNTRSGAPAALADWPPPWVEAFASKAMLPALAGQSPMLALTI
mmetsp:Transcript_57941/g.186081  ORF Transcript_57941/g.186081 Transcript_57941/m.186081 type:complete len:114 (-) Transcript_57941:123-464(-)